MRLLPISLGTFLVLSVGVTAWRFTEPTSAAVKKQGRSSASIRMLRGHSGEVVEVDWSPDGQGIASASRDGTLRLWHAATGKTVRTIAFSPGADNNDAYVQSVKYLSGGKLLACLIDDNLQLIDASSGEVLPPQSTSTIGTLEYGNAVSDRGEASVRLVGLPGPQDVLTSLAATGKWLAAGGWETVETLHTPDGSSRSYSTTGKVLLWRGHTTPFNNGRPSRELQISGGRVLSIDGTSDGRLLAAGCGDGTLHIWSMPAHSSSAPKIKYEKHAHSGHVEKVAFSRRGDILASSDGAVIKLWNSRTGTLRRSIRTDGTALSFSPNGRTLACGGWNSLQLRDVRNGRLRRTIAIRKIESLDFSPNGKLLAVAIGNDVVLVRG